MIGHRDSHLSDRTNCRRILAGRIIVCGCTRSRARVCVRTCTRERAQFLGRSRCNVVIVSVPPDILDYPTSTDMVVREGSNVTLRCAATGTPEPTVTWRREAGGTISLSNWHEGTYWYLRVTTRRFVVPRMSIVAFRRYDRQLPPRGDRVLTFRLPPPLDPSRARLLSAPCRCLASFRVYWTSNPLEESSCCCEAFSLARPETE